MIGGEQEKEASAIIQDVRDEIPGWKRTRDEQARLVGTREDMSYLAKLPDFLFGNGEHDARRH